MESYVYAGSRKMWERVNDIKWLKKEAYEVTRHKEVIREPNEEERDAAGATSAADT